MTRTGGEMSVPVVAGAAAVLDHCETLILAVPLDKYAASSETLKGGTIGKHIRHTLDHFRAALEACSGAVIDYDHREREVPMETLPLEAIEAIRGIRERLLSLDAEALCAAVRVRVMLNGDGAQAELNSTLGRELAFVAHHAVHHHAMMGAIAAEHGVELDQDFGKAPSTVNHERTRPRPE